MAWQLIINLERETLGFNRRNLREITDFHELSIPAIADDRTTAPKYPVARRDRFPRSVVRKILNRCCISFS